MIYFKISKAVCKAYVLYDFVYQKELGCVYYICVCIYTHMCLYEWKYLEFSMLDELMVDRFLILKSFKYWIFNIKKWDQHILLDQILLDF